ncbi:MAG: IS6 family transposase [Phototrophicaceae bacterium]
MSNPFKWHHYEGEIILLCVRWYLRYALSYRDLEEMMSERGLSVVHTTIYRWVQRFAPELEKRMRPHLKQSNDSWRVDETYIKVRGQWMYLYRAVDSTGQTLDFLLNQTRSKRAAKRFFRQVLGRSHVTKPRVINVDQNASYPGAVADLKQENLLPNSCQYRTSKYLNNRIEQDHRFIKRRVKPGLGFFSYITAWRTLQGYEAMNMIRKGQVKCAGKHNIQAQNQFIDGLFGIAA